MRHSRHTFASDMVRAGISLPALMHLMGHSFIQTALLYVQVTPRRFTNNTPVPWFNTSGQFR